MNAEYLIMGIIGYSQDIDDRLLRIHAFHINSVLDLGPRYEKSYFHMHNQEVYEELCECVGSGWISTTSFIENDRRITQYNLSEKGKRVLEQIEQVEPDTMKRIKEILR
jgi:DNA-binding PadR family transcriptional regulator